MSESPMSVSVSNIGGIDDAELDFKPGITVLSGRNATNRTSFLTAIMAAFGSEIPTLKSDADSGAVELRLGDEEYTRTLTRTPSGISYDGDPYLDDSELADLFAFLLETNEARVAVPRGDDLRELIMRPVDTEAIRAKIDELEAEKRRLGKRLEEIDSLEQRAAELEEKKSQRQDEIDAKKVELAEKEAVLEDLDRDIEESREEKSELEETLSELRDARQELENLEYRLETNEERLSTLQSEKTELDEESDSLDPVSDEKLQEREQELQSLREETQEIESEISTLQRVIQFNEDMLKGTSADIARALRADGGATDSGAVTEELLAETEVICWTCGSEVERSAVENTLDRLRNLSSEYHSELRDVESQIEEVKSAKNSLQSRRERIEDLQRKRRQIEREIEDTEQDIVEIESEIEDQSARVTRLEATAESLEGEEHSEILATHKEVNQLEFEIDRLEKQIEQADEELETIRSNIDEAAELETRREEIANELHDQRTKIDRLEQQAVAAFNEHMTAILDILEYENIGRIWLERTQREVREGRKKVTQSTFDLHIVRSTADGTTYEDTIDHLSESEREVTGLIFALAGFLVHEVYEALPIMLLDSLEAIDADRIALLVEYFEQYVDFLIVALLPEDAAALEEPHEFHEAI